MNSIYKTIWNTLSSNLHLLGASFSVHDLRRILRESNPQVFPPITPVGSLDESFHGEVEKIFTEVTWDLLRAGIFVPIIESAGQSNAHIGFNRFFVSMNHESRVSIFC